VPGTSIHPDAKLYVSKGLLYSFRKAQTNLEKLNVHRRPVNNHNNIKLITNEVGAVLAQENFNPATVLEDASRPVR